MYTITIEEVQSQLAEILEKSPPGEEIVLTSDKERLAVIRIIASFQPRAENVRQDIPGKLYLRTLLVTMAHECLAEIVAELDSNEIVLTGNGKLIAVLHSPHQPRREPPRVGTLPGSVLYMAPDFDAIPEGFEDYLP